MGCEPRARGNFPVENPGPRTAGFIQQLIPNEQGRSQGPTGVTSGRLDPEVVEWAFSKQTAVGDAIERHAAGQDEFFWPSAPARGDRSGARPPRPLPGYWQPCPCAFAQAGTQPNAAARRKDGENDGSSSLALGNS